MSHPAQPHWKIAIVFVLATAAPAPAAQFASQVISYSAGAGVGAAYQNPAAALGSPSSVVGQSIGFPSVLSPFSPAFEGSQIVQIGGGGQLTLQLSHYALVGAGLRIGVVSNVGLIDAAYPTGHAGNPAGIFGGGSASVDVSQDGSHWIALGGGNPLVLNMPAMFYTNAGPYDPAPPAGALPSDFGLPFSPAGGLSAFNNLNYSQVVGVFGGAGGGTWLDLSATGLSQVGYIRFSVPAGGNAFNLDAVSIANSAVGAVVPEPSGAMLLIIGGGLAWFWRWRRIAASTRAIVGTGLILLALGLFAGGSQAAEI